MNSSLPKQIGRYQVDAALGAGGMGIVYRAYDEKLQRNVAIKLLHHVGSDTASHQLLHEARTSSSLNHPGICTVYEVETDGEQAFIVMELVEGQRLSDFEMRERPLEIENHESQITNHESRITNRNQPAYVMHDSPDDMQVATP
jgi:serine/threonine protein kinase